MLVIFCPNCGAQIISEAKFCTSCGFNLTSNTEQVEVDTPSYEYDSYDIPETQKNITRTNSNDNFTKYLEIAMEIIAWLFTIVGVTVFNSDAYIAIGIVIAYILYLQKSEKRYRILLVVGFVLLILVTIVGFIEGVIYY